MNVLLSHTNEETQVASILGQWIESSLDRDVRLSGEANIRLDEQRLVEVDRVLGEAQVVLLLCSPWSMGRPWINFEAGCAWLKRVPVIVVCHAGCTPADLPPPLGNFHAFAVTDLASCQALVETLAKVLGKQRVPRINYDMMVAELGRTAPPGEIMPPAATPPSAAPEQHVEQPSRARRAKPESIEARLMAMMKKLPDFTCTVNGLSAGLGVSGSAIRKALKKLENKGLLIRKVSTHPSDPETRYAFTDKGRRSLTRRIR